VLVAVVAVLLAYGSWHNKARSARDLTWKALSALPAADPFMLQADSQQLLEHTISRCEKILQERWRTDATPWVLLRLGSAQQAAGYVSEALNTYRRLADRYPDHTATSMSAPNLAAVLEQTGDYEAARRQYEELANEGGQRSPWWIDVGRTCELAGRRDAAMEAYGRLAPEDNGEKQPEAEDAGEPARDFPLARWRLSRLRSGKPLLAAPPGPTVPPQPAQEPQPSELTPYPLPEIGPGAGGVQPPERLEPEAEEAENEKVEDSPD